MIFTERRELSSKERRRSSNYDCGICVRRTGGDTCPNVVGRTPLLLAATHPERHISLELLRKRDTRACPVELEFETLQRTKSLAHARLRSPRTIEQQKSAAASARELAA
jgi:hypothetical protein